LSTAHAKARLSNRVEEKDAKEAEAILRFALFKEVLEDERRKRRKMATLESDDDDDETSDSDSDEANGTTAAPRSSRRGGTLSTRAAARSSPDADGSSEVGDGLYDASPRGQRTQSSRISQPQTQTETQTSVASSRPESQLVDQQTEDSQGTDSGRIAPARLATFRQALGPLMGTRLFVGDDSADVETVIGAINTAIRANRSLGESHVFQRAEALQALAAMNDRNELM
jgi:DNA replication licensing factor MCM3